MKNNKKYSIVENLFKGQGLGLLKESTRGHVFEDTVVAFMNANGFVAAKQPNYLYDMDFGKTKISEAKCEIKLTDYALLGDISVDNWIDFGFDLGRKQWIVRGSADQSDAARFIASSLNDNEDAKSQYIRMAAHAGVKTGRLMLRQNGKDTYDQWRRKAANWHAVAIPDKVIISVDLPGEDLINYMKAKGVHYIICGVDDENDASGAMIGHLAGDPLNLGTQPVSIPRDGRISVRIANKGGGRGTQNPDAEGTFAGFRSTTRSPSGLDGLIPLAQLISPKPGTI